MKKSEKPVSKILNVNTGCGYSNNSPNSGVVGIEEPRVPPLHISPRGRNASVVHIGNKKEKKLVKEGGD